MVYSNRKLAERGRPFFGKDTSELSKYSSKCFSGSALAGMGFIVFKAVELLNPGAINQMAKAAIRLKIVLISSSQEWLASS